MADFEMVERIMDGIEYGPSQGLINDESRDVRTRTLSLPLGFKAVWAVYELGEEEGELVFAPGVTDLTVIDRHYIRRARWASPVTNELRTKGSALEDVALDTFDMTSIPEGHTARLVEVAPDLDFPDILYTSGNEYSFNDTGDIIIPFGRSEAGYLCSQGKAYAERYIAYMNVLQHLHEAQIPLQA